MVVKRYFIIVLCLISASYGFGAVPVTVEVLEVSKIWDQAPHNAFTDLVRWNDTFYCAFREGRGHVSTDGRIRILESKDADHWESAALVSLEGFDLRDAHLSTTPDDRLMLLGGAAPREKDNQSAPTGTFVSFSKDGRQWTQPQIAVEPGRWLWCVTWHKGKAYGVSYTAGQGNERYLDLLISDDGINYKPHVPKLFEQGYPTEVTLRFDSDETCYALVRRDRRGDDPSSAILGISRPDYKHWQWKDLGSEFNGFGGPNFIQIPGGHWLATGRMHDGGAHTALTYLDVENGTMTKLVKLPSGGDTSYPGMVWYNGMLYVSYYSSHEGKTSIYLAKVKIRPESMSEAGDTGPTKAFLSAAEILKVWEDNYTHFESMKISYTERIVEAIPVAGHPNKLDSLVRFMHVEKVEQGQCFHMQYSYDEEGFNEQDSIFGASFDGEISREYFSEIKFGEITAGLIGRNPDTMNRWKNYICMSKELVGQENPSSLFKHYLIEDPNSKPELSHILSSAITESRVSVMKNLEIIAGQLCHVLEIYNKGKLSQKMWLAHKRGMLPLKHQRYKRGITIINFTIEQIGCIKTDKGLIWYPIKAYRMIDKEYLGIVKYELTTHEFVPDIQVDTNTFIFDFPEGTRINDRVKGIFDFDLLIDRPSLVGKALLPLEDLNIKLNTDQVRDKSILICFWDMRQRPSRNCMTWLAKQVKRLKEKVVTVVTIQASNVDEDMLNEWVKKHNIPFPVGMIQSDKEQTRFNWGVKSLPWLILTDKQHIVIAEGFGLDELNDKIRQTVMENDY